MDIVQLQRITSEIVGAEEQISKVLAALETATGVRVQRAVVTNYREQMAGSQRFAPPHVTLEFEGVFSPVIYTTSIGNAGGG